MLNVANWICLGIFAVEYLMRAWVNTDFYADLRSKGLREAINKKLLWMVRPFSIIDALALIPTTRAVRALRLFRLLRLVRILRVLKLARYSQGWTGYVRGFKKRSYEFLVLGFINIGILLFSAITILCVEKPGGNEQIRNLPDALWWSIVTLTTVGYGDTVPVTSIGRLVAAVLMVTSIGTIGGISAIVTSVIVERIDELKDGQIDRSSYEDHVIFCGWTRCAQRVSEMLLASGELDDSKLLVLTDVDVPDEDYLLYCKGDFADPADLGRANVESAAFVVMFHETTPEVDDSLADNRTVFSGLQVGLRTQKPRIIAEFLDSTSASALIDVRETTETVLKEEIDSDLIINTIRNPGHTSEMLYQITDVRENLLVSKKVSETLEGISGSLSVPELKKHLVSLPQEWVFLGYMDQHSERPVLNPADDVEELSPDSVLYLLGQSRTEDPERIGNSKGPKEDPQNPLARDILFIGWNRCAELVLEKLSSQGLLRAEQKITVLSGGPVPASARLTHHPFSDPDANLLHGLDLSDYSLVLAFHDASLGKNHMARDTRIGMAVNEVARRATPDTKIIAELYNERYAPALRDIGGRAIELIFKEKIDANFIAHSIINPGQTTRMLGELVSFEESHIETRSSHELLQRGINTVKKLRKEFAGREQEIFLGLLQPGATQPELNPPNKTILQPGALVYVLTR